MYLQGQVGYRAKMSRSLWRLGWDRSVAFTRSSATPMTLAIAIPEDLDRLRTGEGVLRYYQVPFRSHCAAVSRTKVIGGREKALKKNSAVAVEVGCVVEAVNHDELTNRIERDSSHFQMKTVSSRNDTKLTQNFAFQRVRAHYVAADVTHDDFTSSIHSNRKCAW